MEEVIKDLEKRHIAVVFTGLRDQPERMLRRINIIPGLVPDHYCFKNFRECVDWIERELTDKNLDEMHRFFDELGDKDRRLTPRFRL